jgi:hypothetical protein
MKIVYVLGVCNVAPLPIAVRLSFGGFSIMLTEPARQDGFPTRSKVPEESNRADDEEGQV